jgi:hypothetical protein
MESPAGAPQTKSAERRLLAPTRLGAVAPHLTVEGK